MTTTLAQMDALQQAFYLTPSPNAASLTYDRLIVGGSVGHALSFKNDYDANGAEGTYNQAYAASVAAGRHGLDANGNKLPWRPEDNRTAPMRIPAAIAYGNPTTNAGTLVGWPEVETGMASIQWVLSQVNTNYGAEVTSSDPHYMAFPSLFGAQSVTSNVTHTNNFFAEQALLALLLLIQSPTYYNANLVKLQVPGCTTVAQVVAKQVAAIRGILDSDLFGGSANYWTVDGNGQFVPPSDGNGGYILGAQAIADNAQDDALTHRKWSNAATLALGYRCCTAVGISAPELAWASKYYANKALAAQVTSASTVNTISGTLPVIGIAGYFPEYFTKDGMGFDAGYGGGDSNQFGQDFYLNCADRTFADSVVAPALGLSMDAIMSRIDSTGVLNLWGDTRVNPYAVGGALQGQPIYQLPGGAYAYAGESDQGAANPKLPPYSTIGAALLEYSELQTALTGSDTNGYGAAAGKLMAAKSYNYVPPVVLSRVSAVPATIQGGTALPLSRVYLTGNAVTGIPVTLSSDRPDIVTVPPTVQVHPGRSSQLFTIATNAVTQATTVTITATAPDGTTKATQLTITPAPTVAAVPVLQTLALSPNPLPGGMSGQGVVGLSAAALTDTLVALASNSAAATLPASVTVPQGSSLAYFDIGTAAVEAGTIATISAALNGASMTATLDVTAPVALPSAVPMASPGGVSATGRVRLAVAASRVGLVVSGGEVA